MWRRLISFLSCFLFEAASSYLTTSTRVAILTHRAQNYDSPNNEHGYSRRIQHLRQHHLKLKHRQNREFENIIHYTTHSRIVTLSSLHSSWFENSYFQDDNSYEDIDLSFLQIDNILDLPPETEDLLRKVTYAYITSDISRNSNTQKLTIEDVVRIIDDEYRFSPVPFSVGNITLTEDERFTSSALMTNASNPLLGYDESKKLLVPTKDIENQVSKILSFAAMHHIPAEITLYLFGDNHQTNHIFPLLHIFEKQKWKSVSFPLGLSIRPKRRYVTSKRTKFLPIPRKSFLTRSLDISNASKAIQIASHTKPPPKIRNLQSVMAEMEQILASDEITASTKSRFSLFQDKQLWDTLAFFPSRSTRENMYQKIRMIQRASVLSYLFVNIIWYTFIIVSRWRITSIVPYRNTGLGNADALILSFRRMNRLLLSVNPILQLRSLKCISAIILITPLMHQILGNVGTKLKISQNTTFISLLSILGGIFVTIGASFIVSYAMMLRMQYVF